MFPSWECSCLPLQLRDIGLINISASYLTWGTDEQSLTFRGTWAMTDFVLCCAVSYFLLPKNRSPWIIFDVLNEDLVYSYVSLNPTQKENLEPLCLILSISDSVPLCWTHQFIISPFDPDDAKFYSAADLDLYHFWKILKVWSLTSRKTVIGTMFLNVVLISVGENVSKFCFTHDFKMKLQKSMSLKIWTKTILVGI